MVRFKILLILLLIPTLADAQLTAPGSRTVRYTSYPSLPGVKDPVFIYCNVSGNQKGELRATSPGGTGPFNFAWYRWNEVSGSFSDLIFAENGVAGSSVTNLSEGGYRVVISGGFDATLTGWIHIDRPYANAQLQNRTCDYVALKGLAVADTFFYKDPLTRASIKLPNAVTFLWSSNPQSVIPFPDIEINPQTFTPPLEDVTYAIQVSDSFGCVNEASFFYESIHVKAEFSAEPVKGEAPLEVAFTDKSVRGTYKYTWDFGETTADGKKVPAWVVNKDSLWIFAEPVTHKYFIPGSYSVSLTIESEQHCVDSFRLEPDIEVEPSDLGIPNVFSPDGDGINDYFIPESKSLRYIAVEIFSRSGVRVYRFVGGSEELAGWQGWDGNVNETSIKASPGVYYYVIRALGWDDVKYDSKEQRGFVYLYR